MKRNIYLLTALLFVAASLNAVPAKRGWQTRTQPDGTTIEVQTIGDEFYHYTINRDGQQVQCDEDGMYRVVGDAPTAKQAKKAHDAAPRYRRVIQASEFGYTPNLAPRGIVIMVNFSDKSFKAANTRVVIDSLCNAVNCKVNKNGNTYYPSAGQYFKDQSNGKYHPVFDVYGPVTLSNNFKYYGENDSQGNDKRAAVAVVEACKKLEKEVDFTKYDSNNDGKVDFVYMMYAGQGEHETNQANQIWPHAFSIDEEFQYQDANFTNVYPSKNDCKVDGKQINTYACSAEISGGALDGIGTLCHEFSHVLGLPDLYDIEYGTVYNGSKTPGDWNIMDGGSYNGDGHCPPNYDPWEKAFMGWLDPINPGNDPQTLTLHPNGTTQYMAYQLNASGDKQAYNKEGSLNYYIENRQKVGWDRCLPGAGMLIWKVNYKKSVWKENSPNASSTSGAPLYTLMLPSGTKVAGKASDAFKSGSWTKLSGKPLTNIKVTNQIVTLNYIGEGTAIETVQEIALPTNEPRKIIRNGQILIVKDGKLYDLTGRVVE